MLYDSRGKKLLTEQGPSPTSVAAKNEFAGMEATKGRPVLGPDEERLLETLRKSVGAGDKEAAPYKLQVNFGKNRTPNGPNNCILTIWESGRMQGSMDLAMTWCGHSTCLMPIRSVQLQSYHVVCPHCQQENFLNPECKETFIRLAKQENMDYGRLERMPYLQTEYGMYNAPTSLIALRCYEQWRKLGGLADLIVKYAPSDIRAYSVADHRRPEAFNQARRDRNTKVGALRYKMTSIFRDISCGADPVKRFKAALAA